jgi:8-oxo-dGTP diphosphatase
MPTIQRRFRTILTARVLLESNDQYLFLAQTKANGGGFTLPGGKIEGEEYAKEALIREVFEEVGLVVNRKDLKLVHITQRKLRSTTEIIFCFHTTEWTGELKVKELDRFKSAIWLPTHEPPAKLTAVLQTTLRRLQKGKLYSEFPRGKKREKIALPKLEKTKK